MNNYLYSEASERIVQINKQMTYICVILKVGMIWGMHIN